VNCFAGRGGLLPPLGSVFCFPLSLWAVEFFGFPPIKSVEAGLPLTLLSYGGFVVVFLVLFLLVSGREIQLKKSSGGVVGFLCRRRFVFGRILSVFFFQRIWSQIYAHPSISAWHALLSRVPRRFPPLPPKVLVAYFTGARCVVLTCQGVFALWLCVKATLRLFRLCLASPGVFGVGAAAWCSRCRRVFYTRCHSGKVCLFSTVWRLVFGFFLPLCCAFPLFPRYRLSLYCINFTGICVG